MPPDVTVFAASYLVFIDVLAALAVLAWVLFRRPHADIVHWGIAAVLVLLLAYGIAQAAGAVYNDPRPFTQDHVRPLIPHAADNGFPSDHALLAAAIVALVLLASPPWAIPFALIAIAVDWARVGAGIHHVSDVVGSSAIVALATVIAALLAPPLARALAPRIPSTWSGEQFRRGRVSSERTGQEGV